MKLMFLFFALTFTGITYGQTTLISPTGDGGFETGGTPVLNNWTAVNSATDGWYVGAVPGVSAGSNCGYISSNGGVAWTYSQTSVIQHIYYDFTIPANESKLALTFKWKVGGEGGTTSDWDNMKVFFGTTAAIGLPVANTAINATYRISGAGAVSGMYKLSSASWNSETINLTGTPGETYRLVFSWKSDISDIANPPAALDEVSLVSSSPVPADAAPITMTFTATTASGMTVNWVDNSTNETAFRVYSSTNVAGPYTQVGADIPSTTTAATGDAYSLAVAGLLDNTTYYFRVVSVFEAESAYLTGSNATLAGTISGDKTIGATGDYASLTAAFAAINVNGLAGSVNLILQADYVSSVETFPIIPSTVATAAKTITVYPAASGLSITSAAVLTTIDMNGSKYVTFDGRVNATGTTADLTINNTNATTTDSRVTVLLRNDAIYNTIKYCNVKGRSTTGSVVFFATTTGTLGNSNNLIDYCNISSDGANLASALVYSGGTAAKENRFNTVSNSNLFDFFMEGTSFGVYLASNTSDWTITGNSFYQTVPRTVTTTASLSYPVYITNTTATGGFTVTNNYIGGNAPLCAGTPYTLNWVTTARANRIIGIYMNVGAAAVSTVTGNTITNFVLATSSGASTGAGIWGGISVNAGNVNVGSLANPNIIGSSLSNTAIVCTSSTSGALIVGINSASAGVVNLKYNQIGGISIGATSTAAIGYAVAGIRVSGGTVAVNSLNITDNFIGSATLADNMISGIGTTTAVCNVIGIQSAAIGNNEIKNNTIANLTVSTSNATTSQAFGVNAIGGSNVIESNTIYALSSRSGNTSLTTPSVVGISNTSAVAGQNISTNTIYNLNNTNATAGVGVTGIQYSGPTLGANLVQRNYIYDLKTASNSSFAVISGVYVGGGTCTVQNNMIALGHNITNGIDIRGINQPLGSGIKFYFNSVYVGGTATGVNSNTFAFHRAQTSSACDVNNNIFVNGRTNATSTGKNYAFRIGSATDYSAAWLVTDYNLFNNTIPANLFAVSTTDYDFAGWKALNATLDPNSIVADPLFVNPTAAIPNLHISMGSPAEGVGIDIPSVTNDFDGDIRANKTPVDIGADAGDYDNIAPTILSFNPANAAIDVPVGSNVVVTFSENVRKVNNDPIDGTVVAFKRVDTSEDVAFTVTYLNKVLTIIPDAALIGFKDFLVTITGVEDMSDNALTGTNSVTFTTGAGDVTPPTISSASVENAAPANVVVSFDENVKITSTTGITVKVDGNTVAINSFAGNNTSVLTFTLATAVTSHQSVTFSFDNALGNIRDVSDNLLATVTDYSVVNNVKSSAKDILTFNFMAADNGAAGITSDIIGVVGTNTVTLFVTNAVTLTSLVPTITTSDYSTVSPLSGEANDFSTSITYTVTAEDLTTKVYTVTVKVVYSLPLVENFDAATIPVGWSEVNTAGVTAPRWTISTTTIAGGAANEMKFTYQNINFVTSRFVTPALNTQGVSNLKLSFRHMLDTYGTGATLKVQSSNDGINWTDESWSVATTSTNIAAEQVNLSIVNNLGNVTYIAFAITGNLYQIDYWYIDNVSVFEPAANDASVTSVASKTAMEGEAIIPTATVRNNGLNVATFDVLLSITDGASYNYSETLSVTGLASEISQSLTFASVTLPTTGQYTATVTTQLAGDEVAANNSSSATYTVLNPANLAYGYVIYPVKAPVYYDLNYPDVLVPIADHASDAFSARGGEWIDGIWYAFDRNTTTLVNRFITINPTTGVKTILNSTGITYAPNDISYDYTTNTLFGVVSFTGDVFGLYSINLETGVLTQIGANSTGAPITLACNLQGQLYSVFTDGSLYTIDKTTGVATVVGSTGVTGITYVQSMAFDHRNGDVLYWNQMGTGVAGGFYTVNTATGAATLKGQLMLDAEIVAFAIPFTPSYEVTFSVVGANGTLGATVDGSPITSPASVIKGKSVLFTATPDEGYEVKEWKLNNSVVTGNTATIYTLENIAANAAVSVEFEAIIYTITYNADGGTHTNPATFTITNLPLTLTDASKVGYTFDGWFDNAEFTGDVVSQITTIGDKLLYAKFELIPVPTYTVTFTVTDGVNAITDAVITFDGTAAAAGVYVFPNLVADAYDYSVAKAGFVTVTGTATVVAADQTINIPMIPVGVNTNALSNLSAYPNPFSNQITISNPSVVSRVVVANLIGQVVMDVRTNGTATVETGSLSKGVYLVTFEAANGESIVRKMVKK